MAGAAAASASSEAAMERRIFIEFRLRISRNIRCLPDARKEIAHGASERKPAPGLVRLAAGAKFVSSLPMGGGGVVPKSILVIALLAALVSPGGAPAAPRERATQVAQTPWLAIRIVQDGKPVRLVRTDL